MASKEGGLNFRTNALSTDQSISMGLKSGEYRGKYKVFAPVAAINCCMDIDLWELRLSITTTLLDDR